MVVAPPPANYQPSTGISVTTVRPMRKRFVALVSLLLFCPFASDLILTQSCPLFLAHCAPPDCTPYYREGGNQQPAEGGHVIVDILGRPLAELVELTARDGGGG